MTELNRIPIPDYGAHPAYGPCFGRPSLKERVNAMRYLGPFLFRAYRDYRQWQRALGRQRDGGLAALLGEEEHRYYERLRREGAVAFCVDEGAVSKLRSLVAPAFESLEALRKSKEKRQFRDNATAITEPAIADAIEAALERGGFLRVASAYMNLSLRVGKVFGLVYCPEDTSFWKKNFEGTPYTSPSTTYMHIDSRFGALKFLLYLGEVGEQNGPFRYVLGSHRFRRSPAELVVRKAVDLSRLDSISLEKRKMFWALPSYFRKKCAFGYDLPEGSEEATALLAREKAFLSSEGNLVLFDYNGVHRGGMVQSGERRILQIQLIPERGGVT